MVEDPPAINNVELVVAKVTRQIQNIGAIKLCTSLAAISSCHQPFGSANRQRVIIYGGYCFTAELEKAQSVDAGTTSYV
jgi:hypothetical protein